MRRPRWEPLAKKAVSACVAAIEIYNKPASPHREDTFVILVVTAWESLLKARLVKEHGSLACIHASEPVVLKDGSKGKRERVRTNRSGNPMTIGLERAMERCAALGTHPLDPLCRQNLAVLLELRDNAIHYLNDDRELARRVHEAGTAALSNFAHAVNEWFGMDLGDHRFAILPLSFETLTSATALVPAARPKRVANLLKFLDEAADAHPHVDGAPYAVALRVETQIVGGRHQGAISVRPTSDPSAPPVRLTDDELMKRFPMDYDGLIARLKTKVPKLKLDKAFHAHMKDIRTNQRLAYERKLNPSRKKTSTTWRYADAAVEAIEKRLKEVALTMKV